ncbi:hypothetical protein, partial [Rheinheimera sp. WS51]|uniref:hypothetical protein n=1 Tax=Rheinheimera sp. WS51 TaxID=3425886 RepID=UPI003D91EF60
VSVNFFSKERYMYKTVFAVTATLILVGCVASNPNKPAGTTGEATSPISPAKLTLEEERPIAKSYCDELKRGLPTEDPLFKLRGKVTIASYGSTYSHEIKQFGKKDIYQEYFVDTPKVPGLQILTCGFIPFFQIAKAEYLAESRFYKITLKNDKTFTSSTGFPFYRLDPDKNAYYRVTRNDNYDETWFWYMVEDPRYKEPREISPDPTLIRVLEVY